MLPARSKKPFALRLSTRCPCSTWARFAGESSRTAELAFARFFHGMLMKGVSLPPSAHEAWFVSAAHNDEAIDAISAAATGAAHEVFVD